METCNQDYYGTYNWNNETTTLNLTTGEACQTVGNLIVQQGTTIPTNSTEENGIEFSVSSCNFSFNKTGFVDGQSKQCFLTGSVSVTGNLTAFNDTSSGLDLDLDWFGNLWHDIVIFMIVIVLLVALCCLDKLCPSVDCSHSGMTTFMIVDLVVVVILWAIGLANPQWFDQYIILSVLMAVIAVEGHKDKDSTTSVYMILSAFTYTVGGFPERWLIWT